MTGTPLPSPTSDRPTLRRAASATGAASRRAALCWAAGLAAAAASALAADSPLRRPADLLDSPSRPSASAARSITTGIAAQGQVLVAVGPRGLILRSADGGQRWAQVPSPVSTDLVTVRFTQPGTVWVVGHDAVLLRSTDGGTQWTRVLDGRGVLALLRNSAAAEGLQAEVERTMQQSASADVWPAPLLDIWFADARRGYAVGGFGLILATTDGGERWSVWTARADNERRFHLYAVQGQGTQVWLAGEQGLLLRLDAAAGRFVKVDSPYNGSWFGLDVSEQRVLACGLRGHAFASTDSGRSWQKLDTGSEATWVAALPLGAEQTVLVSQAGELLTWAAATGAVQRLAPQRGAEVHAAALDVSGRLHLARTSGVSVANLGVEGVR